MVYNFWHNITAARLRGMVSTAKGNNQRPRQKEGAEPSMLRVLRETHRRPDGTYADGRTEYIDQEIQRQLEQSAQRQAEEAPLGSETASGTGGSALTQPDEDELFWQLVEPSQSGRVFGVGGQQPIRERGESSTMAASRVTLERQVQVLEQQLATVIQQMNRYLPSDGSEPNISPHATHSRSYGFWNWSRRAKYGKW
ncbi:unnamed protein product [Arabis nemorensis]|uniref:Uncharacterized protein n=1 Tax=Arabis nemorensis TaxID=586526 RepID=A0A565B0C4_9BRAS|nr:unnamed protein product [Arabis nemorensis]